MNRLSALPLGVFSSLTQLIYLLDQLSPAIILIDHLNCRDIGGNFISNLPNGIFNTLSLLTTLFLNNNYLTRFEPTMIIGLPVLKSLFGFHPVSHC